MNTPKLLPCPFCGGTEQEHVVYGGMADENYIKCKCGAQMHNYFNPHEAWNIRNVIDEA